MKSIRVLSFEGCPNAGPALRLVKEVAQEHGVDNKVESIEISSVEKAEKEHFLGSPSVQVDGTDIEPARRNDTPSFSCRVYRYHGSEQGVPRRSLIGAALGDEGDRS